METQKPRLSPLRQRMIDDMRMRKYVDKTQIDYLRAVRNFTKYLGRSPDSATVEDLRNYQLHLVDLGTSPASLNAAIVGLKFFFTITLGREELMAKMQPVHVPRKLPVILSREEVGRLIAAARNLKHQTALSLAYGTGLRVNEVVSLKVGDIDSQRMTLRVEHNRQLRRNRDLCTWRLTPNQVGELTIELVWARDLTPGNSEHLYGLFKTQRSAKQMLETICDEEAFCKAALGMEKSAKERPCFAYQIKKCRGACVGIETVKHHNMRLLIALQKLALKVWPYAGPVGIKEGKQIHVVDHWRYFGTASGDDELQEVLTSGAPAFDADTYKLLVKFMAKRTTKVRTLMP